MTYKLNENLIEQLRIEKIAIDNKGNPNVELLNQILKTVFPGDVRTNGNTNYYSASSYIKIWLPNTNNLPTIPLLDFIEKEIIGYKAPYDLFDENGQRILSLKGDIFTKKNDKIYTSNNYYLPKEIVETWEPVYKSSEVTIRMGDKFDLLVKNGKVTHGYEDITDFVVKLVEFYEKLPVQFGKYRCEVEEINFKVTGCQICSTYLREWRLVYNELQKQR